MMMWMPLPLGENSVYESRWSITLVANSLISPRSSTHLSKSIPTNSSSSLNTKPMPSNPYSSITCRTAENDDQVRL